MLTTITVNGSEGFRFLSSLGARFEGPIPPALAAMVDHAAFERPDSSISIEVESGLAEEIAAFVDQLVNDGFGGTAPPLLFSAQAGDLVIVVRDVLVELHVGKRTNEHLPRSWRFLARGTRGRFVSRRGDLGKVLLLDGPEARSHAYVSDRSMTRARPVVQRQFMVRSQQLRR
jgi:hypothetical protein